MPQNHDKNSRKADEDRIGPVGDKGLNNHFKFPMIFSFFDLHLTVYANIKQKSTYAKMAEKPMYASMTKKAIVSMPT